MLGAIGVGLMTFGLGSLLGALIAMDIRDAEQRQRISDRTRRLDHARRRAESEG